MSLYFPTSEQCGHHVIFGSVALTTYAGERMQISVVELPEGSVVDWHQHANEQMGMLVLGRALFHVGDEVKELQAGDIYFIPGNVRHKVEPLGGPGKAVDFFYPIRDEYR